MKHSYDIRKKQELNKIVENLTDPTHLLARVIHAIKVYSVLIKFLSFKNFTIRNIFKN